MLNPYDFVQNVGVQENLNIEKDYQRERERGNTYKLECPIDHISYGVKSIRLFSFDFTANKQYNLLYWSEKVNTYLSLKTWVIMIFYQYQTPHPPRFLKLG